MSTSSPDTFVTRMAARQMRPCTHCGGMAFFGGRIGLEHTTGGRGHYFDLVICKGCGKTELFTDEPASVWVAQRQRSHEFFELAVPTGTTPQQ